MNFNSKIGVLITGIGSGVGQGIYKAISLSSLKLNVYVSDISYLNAGLYFTKNRIIIPPLETKQGKTYLQEIIKQNQIKIIFPGNEHDVKSLSAMRVMFKKHYSIDVIVSKIDLIELTSDKWKTVEYFKKLKVPIPETFLFYAGMEYSVITEKLKFPFIVKPRYGTASRGFRVIRTMSELENVNLIPNETLLQELLIGKEHEFSSEFTCSAYRKRDGTIIGPFLARRILRNGTTWIAKSTQNNEVSDYVMRIVSAMKFYGPINVQLIDTCEGPKLLEVNCRFSGTTGIRAMLGFNEPEIAICEYLNINPQNINPKLGTVVRYVEDILVQEVT